MSTLEISVRSGLNLVIEQLAAIRDKAAETGEAFEASGKGVAEELGKNTKRTETFLSGLRGYSRRIADQMRGDFKSLISVNALTDSLKISNMFRKSASETVDLSDKIRKLGTTFGIAGSDFVRFQTELTQGLGEIGLSSEVAGRVLEGLSETQVRGEGNINNYAQKSGMVASIGEEQGKEGEIAGGMARVIKARGGDMNDQKQVNALSDLLVLLKQNGAGAPTKSLRTMEDMFAHMPDEFRKVGTAALSSMVLAQAKGGPGAGDFFQNYLKMNKTDRTALDSQGAAGIFGKNGLNIDKFKGFMEGLMGRIPGDRRAGVKTAGIDDDQAEGLLRLYDNLGQVKSATENMAKTTIDLTSTYRNAMSASEAYYSSLNKVKALMAEPLAWATQKGTQLLADASKSSTGAAAVVGGSAVIAALLAGIGLKGVGRGLTGAVGTAARTKGAEELLGAKTIPVYVVNPDEFGMGGGLANAAGGVLGGAAEGVGGAAAGAAGVAGGLTVASIGAILAGVTAMAGALYFGKQASDAKEQEGKDAANKDFHDPKQAADRGAADAAMFTKMTNLMKAGAALSPAPAPAPASATPAATSGRTQSNGTGMVVPPPTQSVKVYIEANPKDFKVTKQPSQGASFA